MERGTLSVEIPAERIVGWLLFSVVFNIYTIGVGFAIVAAALYGVDGRISGAFQLASAGMLALGTLLAFLRSFLISVVEEFV